MCLLALRKKSDFVYKNRFMLFFFAYTVIYSVVIVNRFTPWEVDGYVIGSFYAVDFSFGLATNLLPGAIFNALFGSHASRSNATVFLTLLMLLFFAGVSFLLQKFMYSVPEGQRLTALLLVLFYLSGAYTFSIFTKTIGLLDSFWLFFSLLFFFFVGKRWLRWLIPALYLATLMVHNGSMISYIILMSLVLLFKASISKNLKEQRAFLIILIISVLAVLGLFAFLSMNESKMVLPLDEFKNRMNECGYPVVTGYYEYAFFDLYEGKNFIPESVYSIEPSIKQAITVLLYKIKFSNSLFMNNINKHIVSIICALIMLLPFVASFSGFHWKCFKREKNILRRICSLLMIVQFPFTFVAATIFSEDMTRWFTHSFLISFTLLLTVLYYEPEQRKTLLGKLQSYSGSTPLIIYFIAYFSLNLFTIY